MKNAIIYAFLVCKIFYSKIRWCKIVKKYHVAMVLSLFPLCAVPNSNSTIVFLQNHLLLFHLFSLCSCIYYLHPMDPQDLKYNMIGLIVILSGSYVFDFLIAIVTDVHSMYKYQSDQRVEFIFFEQLISISSVHFRFFSSSPLLPCRAHKQERSPRLAIS